MKKMLFAMLSICSSLPLSAQKIHFTDTTNVWKELVPEYNYPYPDLYYDTDNFIGDTTIGSLVYRIFSFGIVREDTISKKVYLRMESSDSDVVLIDYNLNVGDTFTTIYNQFVVTGIDSTLINAVWHKVWHFPTIIAPIMPLIWVGDTLSIVEGIGCIQHPTYMLRDFSGCIECMLPYMYCFSSNGITPPLSPRVSFFDNTSSCATFPTILSVQLQSNRNKISIFPNPATTSLTIYSTDRITTVTITNLLGQTLYYHQYSSPEVQVDVSNLPAGMYLVKINGSEVRKFIRQ